MARNLGGAVLAAGRVALAAWLIQRESAIEFGLLVTLGSFLLAVPVLGLLAWGRAREERRSERRGGFEDCA